MMVYLNFLMLSNFINHLLTFLCFDSFLLLLIKKNNFTQAAKLNSTSWPSELFELSVTV